MTAIIHGFPFGNELTAPSSKSVLQRAIICAAFCEKETKIYCNNLCDDVKATVNAVTALGAKINFCNGFLTVIPTEHTPVKAEINCNESGATLRFMMPICAALGVETTFSGSERLINRPNDELKKTLINCGCRIEFGNCFIKISGKIKKNPTVNAEISSQYISGLMLADAVCKEKFEIKIDGNRVSSGYIDITKGVLNQFGLIVNDDKNTIKIYNEPKSPSEFISEGDWSAASFFTVAASLAEKNITVHNLSEKSLQPDKIIVDILHNSGVRNEFSGNKLFIHGIKPNCFKYNAEGSPDIVPPLVALACGCNGTSEIYGVSRLKYKESNRIESLCSVFTSIGANIRYENERLIISGKEKLSGGVCESFNDHRIAMAVTAACPICEKGVRINGFECVSKSFPNFKNEIICGEFI